MTNAAITKTLAKVSTQRAEYSLGFRRLLSLPESVRADINMACILRGESDSTSVKDFLNGLTEIEFADWLKLS